MTDSTSALARVVDALDFAAAAHRDQRRKDAARTPYINHPLGLVRILVEAGVEDTDVLCAAALHDYLEDCCGGPGQPSVAEGRREIESRYGPTVLAYVLAVTDDKSLDKATRKRRQVEHAPHAPHGARLVKLADKIANVRDIAASPPAGWDVDRRVEYVRWSLTVVDAIRGTHAVLESRFDATFALADEGLR